jgi:hypothetical protein
VYTKLLTRINIALKVSVNEYVSVRSVERVQKTVNMYKNSSKIECD